MATAPRIIRPGRPIHLVIRAVNRQYRFVPTENVVASIRYIFWHCVDRYGMSVHDANWMSNHSHIILTDERGVLPQFVCKMNSLISRQLNTIRRTKGTNFEKHYADIEILDDETMVGYCAYSLANPCTADLVTKASSWKGVSTYKRNYGETFKVKRPKCGLWSGSALSRRKQSEDSEGHGCPMPGEVSAQLVRPKVMNHLKDAELRLEIRMETAKLEAKAAEKRRKTGKKVLKWRNVTKNHWTDSPLKPEKVFEKQPRAASRDDELLLAAMDKIASFNQAYKKALNAFRDPAPERKNEAIFPVGTWKMRVQFNVKCGVAPPG